MAKPLGWDIEMLGVRPSVHLCVRHKACKLQVNFRFHAPIYMIFDPVMHTAIAFDEFEED